ncbi:hypothetical protein BDK51DRAFT_30638, partial [Blyttiomyces helicus]
IRSLGSRVVNFFLRHASLVRPLNELVKMKLASDISQLEFALNEWFASCGMRLDADIGESYRCFKAFKPLLYLDLAQIPSPHHTGAIPTPIILHHLFSRAHPVLPLPTTLHGWSEAQYSEWLDVHSADEAVALLEQCADAYAEAIRRRGDREFCVEYPVVRALVAASVAARARSARE